MRQAVRLAPDAGIRGRARAKVVQYAGAVRWCICNVDDTSSLVLPGCVDRLAYPAEDILGQVSSTRGVQTTQESIDFVGRFSEIEELNVGMVTMVLIPYHSDTHLSFIEEILFDVGYNALDLLF